MQHRARPRPTDATGGQRRSRPPPHGAPPAARRPPAPPDPDPAEGAGGCGAVRAGVHLRPLRSAVRVRRRYPPAGLCVPVTPPRPPERRPLRPCLSFPTAPRHRPGAPQRPRAAEGPPSPPPPAPPPPLPTRVSLHAEPTLPVPARAPPRGLRGFGAPHPGPPPAPSSERGRGEVFGGRGGELKANLRGGLTGRKGRAPPAPLRGQRERRAKRYTLTGNLCAVPPLCGCPPRTPPSPFLRFHAPPAPRHRALQHPAVPQHPPPSPRTPIPARQPRPCPPPAGSRSRTALRRRSGGAGAAGGQRQQQRGGGGGGGSGLSAARSPPGDSSDGDSADGDRGGGGGGGGTSGGRSSNRRPSPPAGPGGSSGGAALWRRGAGSGAGRCAPGFFSNFSSGFMAAERLAGPWAVRGGAGRRGGAAPLALGLRRGGGAPAPPPRPAPPGTCPPPAPGGASRSRVAPPARSAAQLRSPPYAHGALTQRASHAAPPPPPPIPAWEKPVGTGGAEGGLPLRLCSRFASIPRCLATPGRGGGIGGRRQNAAVSPRVPSTRGSALRSLRTLGAQREGRDGKLRHGSGGAPGTRPKCALPHLQRGDGDSAGAEPSAQFVRSYFSQRARSRRGSARPTMPPFAAVGWEGVRGGGGTATTLRSATHSGTESPSGHRQSSADGNGAAAEPRSGQPTRGAPGHAGHRPLQHRARSGRLCGRMRGAHEALRLQSGAGSGSTNPTAHRALPAHIPAPHPGRRLPPSAAGGAARGAAAMEKQQSRPC